MNKVTFNISNHYQSYYYFGACQIFYDTNKFRHFHNVTRYYEIKELVIIKRLNR